MNFVKKASCSGIGAGVGILAYIVVTSLLVWGKVDPASAVINAVVVTVLFGVASAIVHGNSEPSLAKSLAVGAGVILSFLALALSLGVFLGFSVGAVVGIALSATSMGVGGYVGAKCAK